MGEQCDAFLPRLGYFWEQVARLDLFKSVVAYQFSRSPFNLVPPSQHPHLFGVSRVSTFMGDSRVRIKRTMIKLV